MPRFVNLKGSMNTFDNNKPVLSSSERLKNKRDKTIYHEEQFYAKTVMTTVHYVKISSIKKT